MQNFGLPLLFSIIHYQVFRYENRERLLPNGSQSFVPTGIEKNYHLEEASCKIQRFKKVSG